MTVTDPIQDGLTSHAAPGTWHWLLTMLRQLFSSSSATTHDIAASEPQEADSAVYVVAPGGYRIRVPQADDVHRSIGEMIPSVKHGLNLVPPLPRAVTELLREIQDPKATATTVATIAASDPSLAASLIRTVNSAAFGLHRKITSVAEAVSYLGFSSVKSLVLRLQLDVTLGGKAKSNDDVEDLWIHSLIVSYIADTLARRVPGVDRGFVSTLGLLHDIGKLVIHTQFPAEAAQLRNAPVNGSETLLQREQRVLGVDHAELGATLAGKWGLPGDLVKAIRWHHLPSKAFEPGDPKALHQSMSILQIADQLAKYCYVYGDETEIDAVTDAAFDAVGFGHDLTALLDKDVRGAASRAIFFADDGASRSTTSVRRFLRLNRGEAGAQLLVSLGAPKGTASQVLVDDELSTALFSNEGGASRFKTTAAAGSVQKLVADVMSAESRVLSGDSHMAMSLISRCLLANAVGPATERVEAAVGEVDGRTRFAIRSSSLSFATRFGDGCEQNAAVLAVESELANVLNLAWFDSIATSSDGSTLMFTAKAA